MFYDFNGLYHPAPSAKRIVPEIQAGLGGVNMKFYYNQQDCNAFTGCSNSSSYLQSSNHFQLHAGAGVSFFVTPNIYVRRSSTFTGCTTFSNSEAIGCRSTASVWDTGSAKTRVGQASLPSAYAETVPPRSGAPARSSNDCGGL